MYKKITTLFIAALFFLSLGLNAQVEYPGSEFQDFFY
jgi:hypothetical protein